MTEGESIVPALAGARAQLRRGSKEAALTELLAAWQALRSPALADLVDQLSHLLEAERPPPALGGNKQKAWTDALERATPADLPRLYAALTDTRVGLALVRLEQLRERPADPRLARWLWTWLRDVPFTGPSSRKFYLEAAAQLRTLADPRLDAEILASRDGDHTTGHYTVARLSGVGIRTAYQAFVELTAEVEARPPIVVDPDVAETLAALTLAIGTAGSATENDQKAEAALLAAVFADPANDEPRLVYADSLQRRGDPRGEFIVLQCFRQGTDAKPTRRERELLAKHGADWTDGLGPFLRKSGREFQRGFLSACRFFHPTIEPDPLVVEAWATIESIDLGTHPYESKIVELLSHPRMTQLRSIRGLALPDFVRLCALHRALPVERIHLGWGDSPRIEDALLECRSLPKLRQLDLRDCETTPELATALKTLRPDLDVTI